MSKFVYVGEINAYINPSLAFTLKTPARFCVKAFRSPRVGISGALRFDHHQVAIDPWTASMKWLEHMEQRGWGNARVDAFDFKNGKVVIITLEKL